MTAKRKLRIILLEDDEVLRRLLERLIRDWREDIDLLVFCNGYDVWWEVLRSLPDVLITDEYHDGLHGNVILRHLVKKHAPCSVLWTAADGGFDLSKLFGGVVDGMRYEVLPRPFEKKQFLQKLDCLTAHAEG